MLCDINENAIKGLFTFWVELIDSNEKIEEKEQLIKCIVELIENGNIKNSYLEDILYVEDEEHFNDYSLEYIAKERLADYLKTKLHLALHAMIYNARKERCDIDKMLGYFKECSDSLDEYVYQKNIKRAVTFQEQMQCVQTNEIEQLFVQYTVIIKQGSFVSMNELQNIERSVFRILDLE